MGAIKGPLGVWNQAQPRGGRPQGGKGAKNKGGGENNRGGKGGMGSWGGPSGSGSTTHIQTGWGIKVALNGLLEGVKAGGPGATDGMFLSINALWCLLHLALLFLNQTFNQREKGIALVQ